jgi:hypothetical protein
MRLYYFWKSSILCKSEKEWSQEYADYSLFIYEIDLIQYFFQFFVLNKFIGS